MLSVVDPSARPPIGVGTEHRPSTGVTETAFVPRPDRAGRRVHRNRGMVCAMTVPNQLPRLISRGSVILLLVAAVLVVAVGTGPVMALGQPPAYAEPGPRGVWPLAPAPAVVARFDPPASKWGSGHRGVDLLGVPVQPVRAALAGQVSFAGRIAGRGIVVVDHGDTRTTYEPVRARRKVGAEVRAGDRIGVLETFGSHCFPRSCLHWGWVRGARYLDPLLLVGAGPVRLLPLWRDLPQQRVTPPSPPPLSQRSSSCCRARPVLPSVVRPWAQAQARGCACW